MEPLAEITMGDLRSTPRLLEPGIQDITAWVENLVEKEQHINAHVPLQNIKTTNRWVRWIWIGNIKVNYL